MRLPNGMHLMLDEEKCVLDPDGNGIDLYCPLPTAT
jgi:hypothetical protein